MTLLHGVESEPGKLVSPLAPFTTTSGLKGYTYTTRSVAESSRVWFVTNGTRYVRLDVRGGASGVRKVTAELEKMARSITWLRRRRPSLGYRRDSCLDDRGHTGQ